MIVGQDAARAALARHVARSGGRGSTLILGPEGVGRFLLAREAARAVLGATRDAAARVDALTHPDLHVLETGAGIDGVRAAREALARRPSEGARPVLIVRDADRLSHEALNALLKTLEEPSADAAVFVVAESADFLPETVVSRCRIVRARALSREETSRVLSRLGLPADAAGDADGSPGRAAEHARAGIAEAAGVVVALLERRHPDPLDAAERLSRKRGDEDGSAARRRHAEILRAAAARLRPDLPRTEPAVRALVEGLGALERNANAGVLFAELALTPWKRS